MCHTFKMKIVQIMALAALGLWVMLRPVSAAEKVDLALVLAVDCSGSVSRAEYTLQVNGIAQAFLDPAVIAAASSGPNHRIAVNLMTWGDPEDQKFVSGWHIIATPKDGEAFSKIAAGFDRRMNGGTGIGVAIAYGLALLNDGTITAQRQTIDVSGDGEESYELRALRFTLADAQRLREKAGVTVNGLAIQNEDTNLGEYYRRSVAAGPESFVIAINSYQDYAEAIRRKLLLEINPNMASLILDR
jgi:Protein of unknown function (DUF1194)